MVKVKPLKEVSERYREAARFIPARYKRALEQKPDWKTAALEGQELYEEKMSDPEVLKRRAGAIERVSNEEWVSRALKKGAPIIGKAIELSVEKHAKKWAPFREALEAVELPKRVADPMANIDNRLKEIVRALVEKKKELTGG